MLPGQAGLATTIFANAGNVGNLTGYFGFGALLEQFGYRGVCTACGLLASAMLLILLFYRARIVRPTIAAPADSGAYNPVQL